MLNQIILVGRINKITEEGAGMMITIAVPRSFKNEEGEYETDYIDCYLWKGIAEQVKEYCKESDIVGIKGRMQTDIIDDTKIQRIIVEKLTFLGSKKEEKENENV